MVFGWLAPSFLNEKEDEVGTSNDTNEPRDVPMMSG